MRQSRSCKSYILLSFKLKTLEDVKFCNFSKNNANIYDFGFVNNWKLFLGFDDSKSVLFSFNLLFIRLLDFIFEIYLERSLFRKVILPSSHKPLGDGINWEEYFNFAKMGRFKPCQRPIISI